MGSLFSKRRRTNKEAVLLEPKTDDEQTVQNNHETKKRNSLTEIEKTRLIQLGTLTGSPGIVMEALESGNILDPAHMDRAQAIHDEWERGRLMINEALKRQAQMEGKKTVDRKTTQPR